MAEEKEPSRRVHKVTIHGTVEGYEVASLEDLKYLLDEIKNLKAEINNLKGQFSDLQKALNATNLRFERLENFLKSFK